MAKPICVVKVDHQITEVGDGRKMYEMQRNLEERMFDYHVFVIPFDSNGSDTIQFQVFHEKDFTEIQYQELKGLILSTIGEKKVDTNFGNIFSKDGVKNIPKEVLKSMTNFLDEIVDQLNYDRAPSKQTVKLPAELFNSLPPGEYQYCGYTFTFKLKEDEKTSM